MTDRTAEEGEAAEERSDERAEEPTEGRGEDVASGPTDGETPDTSENETRDPASTDAEAEPKQDQGEDAATEAGTDTEKAANEESTAAALAGHIREYDDELAEQVRAELEAGERAAAELQEKLAVRDRRIEDLESRVEELEGKLKRKQADFQNFKKRQQKKVADQQARATQDLLQRLLPVHDNLVRALEQDENADIREGVEGTLREFDRVLDAEDVTEIDPDPGTETDPERHEVMMRIESDLPEGTVVDVFRPGYEMNDRVVRTAQVTVSEGADAE